MLKMFLVQHNLSFDCQPSRLCIIGRVEISWLEGRAQDDPVAMGVCAIAIIPVILMFLEITDQYPHETSKATTYADDFRVAGTVKGIKYCWEQLCQLDPLFA